MLMRSPIRTRAIALSVAALATAAIGLAPASASADTTCLNRNGSTQTLTTQQIEDAMLCITNNERRAAGLTPLRSDAKLVAAARAHSQDMVVRNYNSHYSPENVGPDGRIAQQGYSFDWWAENILYGFSTPAEGMAWWMNSPGHRGNILSTKTEEIGIGVYRSGSTVKYTQVFASPTGAVGNGPTGLEPSYQDPPPAPPTPPIEPTQPTQPTQPSTPSTPSTPTTPTTPSTPATPTEPAPPAPRDEPATVPQNGDTDGPGVTISRFRVDGDGIAAKVACDERCGFEVSLVVKRKGRTQELGSDSFGRSSKPRTVRFELSRKALRKLDGQKVTIAVKATDAAGNTTTAAKGFWV